MSSSGRTHGFGSGVPPWSAIGSTRRTLEVQTPGCHITIYESRDALRRLNTSVHAAPTRRTPNLRTPVPRRDTHGRTCASSCTDSHRLCLHTHTTSHVLSRNPRIAPRSRWSIDCLSVERRREMVRKARMTVIVSGAVAALTCGSTLNAARDATREARADRDP